MKASELTQKIDTYRWLETILYEYETLYERLKGERPEDIRIEKIGFINRSDKLEEVRFNIHKVIDPKPFLDAIAELITSIKEEMQSLRAEIETIVEL